MRTLVFISLVLIMTNPASAQELRDATLNNGLRVIVEATPGTGLVAINAVVDVGAGDEPADCRGCAHFVEHMVFKGTRRLSASDILAATEEKGGYFNAMSWYDDTTYQFQGPREQTREVLDVMMEMLFHSIFPAEEFAREQKVLVEEIQQHDDDAASALSDATLGILLRGTRYGHPIQGYKNEIALQTRERVLRFYGTHYVPNRTTIIVVGDVDADEVLTWIDQATRDLLPRDVPSRRDAATKAALRNGEGFELYRPLEESVFALSWQIPTFGAAEYQALAVAATMLAGSESAYLKKHLLFDEGMVTSISASMIPFEDGPGLLQIEGTCAPERVPEVRQRLKELHGEFLGLDEGVFRRAKQRMIANHAFAEETGLARAERIAFYLGFDALDRYDAYEDEVEAVTLPQVHQAFRDHLPWKRGVWTVALPEDAQPTPTVTPTVPIGADTPTPSPTPQPSTVRFTLENGLTVVTRTAPKSKLLAASLVFRGGVATEEQMSLPLLLADMLPLEGGSRDIDAMSDVLDTWGVSLGAAASMETIHVGVQTTAGQGENALGLLRDVIIDPRFSGEALEVAQNQAYGALRSREDDGEHLAVMLAREVLADRHPYGRDPLGSERSIGRVDRGDIRRAWRDIAKPSNGVLAVVGPQSTETLRRLVEGTFGDMKEGVVEFPDIGPLEAPSSKEPVVRARLLDREQQVLVLASVAPGYESPDYGALLILEEVLNSTARPRVWRLREELGLAYHVAADYSPLRQGGFFTVGLATSPEQAGEAYRELLTELADVATVFVTDAEIDAARIRILTRVRRSMESVARQAAMMAINERNGFGWDALPGLERRLRAVQPQDVYQVAQKVFPGGYPGVTVLVGPLSENDFTLQHKDETEP